MADIIIPDVPDDVIAAIDVKAQRLGLSRENSLRRALARERNIQTSALGFPDSGVVVSSMDAFGTVRSGVDGQVIVASSAEA